LQKIPKRRCVELDYSDKGQVIDPATSILLKNIVSPVSLNLPSTGKVDIFFNRDERPVLTEWLNRYSIGYAECMGSPAITIYNLGHLALSKNGLDLTVKKDRWQNRKAELEQFILEHHWPIRPVGNTISVQLPADDVSSNRIKTIVTDLLQADLLNIYQHRLKSSDFQLIAIVPPNFTHSQRELYLSLTIWLSTETHYYYQIEE